MLQTFNSNGRSGHEGVPRVDKHRHAGGAPPDKKQGVQAQELSAIILGVQCGWPHVGSFMNVGVYHFAPGLILRALIKSATQRELCCFNSLHNYTIKHAAQISPRAETAETDTASDAAKAAAAAAARTRLIFCSSIACRLLCGFLGQPIGSDLVQLGLLLDVPRIIERLASGPPLKWKETKPTTRPQRTGSASN